MLSALIYGLLTMALTACAANVAPTPGGPQKLPPSAWRTGDTQGVELLARVVQTDTQQPYGREAAAAVLIRDFLLRAGIEAELIPLGAGRASLIARIPGPPDVPPLLLLSHLDTHPATAKAWPQDAGPHSGTIKGDALWGRGVLGGKGLAVLHALTLAALQDSQQTLDRPIVMLATAGGLESGTPGLSQALKILPTLGDVQLVLTKGGGSWIDLLGDGRTAHTIANSERGFARVRITATARESDRDGVAVERLNDALAAVLNAIEEPRLTRPTLDTLEFASEDAYFPKNLVMRSTPLAQAFMLLDMRHRPSTSELVTGAIDVTYVGTNRAGGQVTPDRAWAILECRMLPGVSPGQLRARLRGLIRDPDVHVDIRDGASWSGTPLNPDLLAAVTHHAEVAGPQMTVPIMDPEPSGARVFRDLGAEVFGFTPYVLTTEQWGRIKGRKERLGLEDFRRGLRTLTHIVFELAHSAK